MFQSVSISRFLFVLVVLVAVSCKKDDPTAPTQENNLALGNPSNAGTSDDDNYLMTKTQFTLSYNRSRGTANWVSWHLSEAWRGNVSRQDNFRTDTELPSSWFRAATSDYTGTGFDRGHLCPSDDRTLTETDNSATFLMTNIIPQAPDNNREPWKYLEEYCRKLSENGNELYIIAGAYGEGGTGSNGGTTKTIADKNITVPARLFKVILVLPNGENDLKRITSSTRVIAIDIPNKQSSDNYSWDYYRVSVRKIEEATGLDFFSKLSSSLQTSLETKTDNETIQ
jgi:endonuclease G